MFDLSAFPPETRRLIEAGAVAGAYALFCAGIAVREALRAAAVRREAKALSQGAGEPVLVAFASQTGLPRNWPTPPPRPWPKPARPSPCASSAPSPPPT